MNLKRYHLPALPKGSKMVFFLLGQPYPIGSLVRGTCGATLHSFVDGSTLCLNLMLPRPNPDEYLGFREGFRFRIYQGKDMPGGLLLMRLLVDGKEVGTVFEVPFDALNHERLAPGSLARFFTARKVAVLTTLTDTGEADSRIIAIRMLELPPPVLRPLRRLWQAQISSGLDYAGDYQNLSRRKSIDQIWRAATVI